LLVQTGRNITLKSCLNFFYSLLVISICAFPSKNAFAAWCPFFLTVKSASYELALRIIKKSANGTRAKELLKNIERLRLSIPESKDEVSPLSDLPERVGDGLFRALFQKKRIKTYQLVRIQTEEALQKSKPGPNQHWYNSIAVSVTYSDGTYGFFQVTKNLWDFQTRHALVKGAQFYALGPTIEEGIGEVLERHRFKAGLSVERVGRDNVSQDALNRWLSIKENAERMHIRVLDPI